MAALRSCSQSGNRPPDDPAVEEDHEEIEPRFLSGTDYWRQRFNDREIQIAQLRVQIRELDEEKRLLQQQVDAANNAATTGISGGTKGASKLDLQFVVENDDCMRKWSAYKAIYEPITPGKSIFLLIHF